MLRPFSGNARAVAAAVLRVRFGVRRLLVRGHPCDQ